ncbi:MAG: hypothetical protein QMD85_00150 [Candidatus Aenigmarchaeota archaeon]|nr:hypothetical protein [Candidatus Aenigmarchaeota archaeon]MDI6721938.1 hypothetical protein [Candidatus Aenigmarchaeota archaeon]
MNKTVVSMMIGFVILLLALTVVLFIMNRGQSGTTANLETILGLIRGG